MKKISVIILAHNEENYIVKCLDSIKKAESNIAIPVEIIVVLNRCTDNTEDIAKNYGAITIQEDMKNIAKVRNTGVKASIGEVLVTIDADSWMTPNMFQEVICKLQSGKYIGGGVKVKPERISVGIFFCCLILLPYMIKARISAGMFWLYRSVFDSIGGFDESYVSAEDVFFAQALKAYGNRKGLKYGTIRKEHIFTSCRKFDTFGDWFILKRPRIVKEILTGNNQKEANGYFYDVDR